MVKLFGAGEIMNDYYYEYSYTYDELISILNDKKLSYLNAFLNNGMALRIKTNRIVVIKKATIQHPLQRNFVGEIVSRNTTQSAIKGCFKYPLLNCVLLAVFTIVIIYGHLSMLLSHHSVNSKIICSFIFISMYVFCAWLYASGKKLFKKEEQYVLNFFEEL